LVVCTGYGAIVLASTAAEFGVFGALGAVSLGLVGANAAIIHKSNKKLEQTEDL